MSYRTYALSPMNRWLFIALVCIVVAARGNKATRSVQCCPGSTI